MASDGFVRYLARHGYSPDDVVPGSMRGTWRVVAGCPGGDGCRHAFRGALGPCDGSMPLCLGYAEHGRRDSSGRFLSPYREWQAQREARNGGSSTNDE